MLELISHNSEDLPLNWYALVGYFDNMRSTVYQELSGEEIEPLYLFACLD